MQPERIGPYRIDGLLGQGGMGTVYRAFDERLRRPVAIKQIRGAELADPVVRERFWREARSAAEMQHPAIVRIYHMDAEQGRDYVVMELVEGRTLAATLRGGPLAPRRAAELFRELAEGLAEAHGRGIVHRDLKAENVMVTPRGRVKVLDFGLAKRLEPSEAPLSAAGTVVGTLYTMSPEQAQGEPVDERSDLFSLGAVLYQALAGQPPFHGKTPSETLAKVCMHHPPPLASLDPRVPPALSDLVVRLLQKDPDARPTSAAAVAEELGRVLAASEAAAAPAVSGDAPTVSFQPGDSPRPRRRRLGVALGAAAVMAAAAWLGPALWLGRRAPAGPEPAAPPPSPAAVRPAVAVLGLEQLTPGPGDAWPGHDWLATALGEMLATELAAGGAVRVVGGGEAAPALRALAVERPSELDRHDLARLGKVLGADRVVWGTYGDLGEPAARLLRLDLRLQDSSSGEVLAASGATGTPGELFALVDRAAARFREELGAASLTPAETLAAEASLPRDAEAVRLYSEGLARLRQLDALAARGLFEQAIAAQPDHPMPYAALAEAWSTLGYEEEARQAAGRARELAGSLDETTRRRIEARHHAAAQEWEQAVGVYGALFASYPDDVDLGLQLAEAQIRAGEVTAAQVTIEALRRLPEPLGSDPRIDLAAARACDYQGDREHMLAFAERAARAGEALGAPLIVAEARLRQTTALQDMGEFDRAMSSLEEAKRLFDGYGDRQGSAKALELMAHAVRGQHGDLVGARRLFSKALAGYREIGNRRRAAGVQGMLGSILINEGKLPEALDVLEQTLATFQELGDKREAAIVLNNLGFVLFMQGAWDAAIARYTESLNLSDELGNRSGVAIAYTNVAEILYVRGDLDQARKMHEEALAINREILDAVGIAYDTFRLGKVCAAKGDLFAARQRYEEALAAQTQLGEAAAAAQTRVELALVDLIEGRSERAETQARQAEEVLRNEGWSDQAALAGAVLVRSLLAQGRLAEARRMMTRLEAGESQDRRVRLLTAITAARLRAASPQAALAAVADLDAVAADAQGQGYLEEHFEARLAAGEIEAAFGNATEAAERLAALANEASRRGFGQIARQAEAVQGRTPDHRDASPDSKPSAKIDGTR